MPLPPPNFQTIFQGRGGLGRNDHSRIETALTIPAYLGAVSARTPFEVPLDSPTTHRALKILRRCWRVYEFYGHASNGPDQSDTSRIVYLVRLISIWYYISNGSCFS